MSANVSVDPTPPGSHRTVARTMAILETVMTRDSSGVRLVEVSEALEAPKSSVQLLAKGLVATGYLREEAGKYFVGPAVARFMAVSPSALPSVYHQSLEKLQRQWGETAMLATLVGDSVIYIDSVESEFMIRYNPELDTRRPLLPGSAGKCFLAFSGQRRVDAYLRQMKHSALEREQIRDELARVREQRVCINIGGVDPDNIGIASPIIFQDAPVAFAIAVGGLKSRMADHVDEIAESVRAMADNLAVSGVRTLNSP
ncbi:IclR family transcriptional regulator [Rhodococcus opacus]|nr:IclR family transcriptional regulator [Rhodococcus opacus]